MIRATPLVEAVRWTRGLLEIREWLAAGCRMPPPQFVKRRIIDHYRRRHGISVLIETGTYFGGTVEYCRRRFHRIYSIELDDALAMAARARFRRWRHISIVHGDSGVVLPRILSELTEAALFWLDGHYSGPGTAIGEPPILLEVEAVLNHALAGHVVLIDDARCFTGEDGYPTIDHVERLLQRRGNEYTTEIACDIIRSAPSQGVGAGR